MNSESTCALVLKYYSSNLFLSIFQSFLKGDTQIMADEAFQNAVQSYYEVFLRSDRVLKIVQSGACSQHDFREVFRNNIEKRVR